jgi:hypothetical protein
VRQSRKSRGLFPRHLASEMPGEASRVEVKVEGRIAAYIAILGGGLHMGRQSSLRARPRAPVYLDGSQYMHCWHFAGVVCYVIEIISIR